MSKGSSRRPAQVPPEVVAAEWDRIFTSTPAPPPPTGAVVPEKE